MDNDQPVSEPTLVLVEDISFTDRLEPEAMNLGGYLESRDPAEYSALFHFPARGKARDFIFVAKRQGYRATITPKMFPIEFSLLEALREDAQRIRRALRKQPLRPPWAKD